jgi:ketosteroid isomerase-like protein
MLLLVCLTILSSCQAQSSLEQISKNMAEQEASWNKGDVEAFMAHYWKSDSLKFIGSKGLTYGWQQTLENYKKGYPDKSAMGQLTFTNHEIRPVGDDYVYVVGKWELAREELDDLSGHYTLLWQLIDGHWVIISDHSS